MVEKLQNKYRAARKVARLYSGQMTPEDARDVASWKEEGEEFQQDFLDMAQGLADMEALQDDPDVIAMVEDASAQLASTRLRAWRPTWAAAVLALGVGLVINPFDWGVEVGKESAGLRYVTRVGEQKTVELSDGSEVTLNTGTELLVRIDDKTRYLELRRGEAYFDVVGDPTRPFTVELGENKVTVLGTEFNIFKTPETITLAVLEGSVSLHKSELEVVPEAPLITTAEDKQIVLGTLEQSRIEAGQVVELSLADGQLKGYAPDNIEQLRSWRNGQLRFDNEPLKEVIHQLNRYSAKKILIEDESIMNLKIYAVMRIDRIDLALTSLEKTQPIKAVRYFDRTILVGK